MSNAPRKHGATLPIVVTLVTLAALLGLYIVLYCQTVRVIPDKSTGVWEFRPGYSLRAINPAPHWWDVVFAPLHEIDKHIRPELWSPYND